MTGTITPINQAKEIELANEAEDFLASMPAKFAACHGLGHAFPKPGRKGFTLRRDSGGYQELEMVCRDCGMIRTIVAEPGERIVLPAKRYIYYPPKGYKAPKGTGKYLPRRAYAQEITRRWHEEIKYPTGGEEIADLRVRK
jgi:hypothetical protein